MSDNSPKAVERGQAIYTKSFLSTYDLFVLGFFCRFIWRCPSHHILAMYNQHVSANHLDIGVGTGYFLDHCKFPGTNPRLGLMDLNPNTLEVAGKRLSRYTPEIYHVNVLKPIEIRAQSFDSVGLTHLLRCLPRTIKEKGVVFKYINKLLNPGGIVFGSTLLYKGVNRNMLATFFMNLDNSKGIMTNKEDDLESLKQMLSQYFSESSVDMRIHLTFIRENTGKVSRMILWNYGKKDTALKVDRPLPEENRAIELDPQIYDAYAGHYQIEPGLVFTITKEANGLMAQLTRQGKETDWRLGLLTGKGKEQLFPGSEAKFFYKVVDAQITFAKDEKGKVTHLILHQNGDKQAKKID